MKSSFWVLGTVSVLLLSFSAIIAEEVELKGVKCVMNPKADAKAEKKEEKKQPYLQGYWPIAMLAQRARYGLFPAQGDVIATGPHFVTGADAAKAIELSRRSIR